MPWEAIRFVTSGITLLAFLAALGAWVYRQKILQKEKLIQSASEKERGRLVAATLEFFAVETGKLKRDQQFELALEQIRNRARRSLNAALLTALAFIIFGILALVAISQIPEPDPVNQETNYQLIDSETGEPIYQSVVVHYQRDHEPEELTSISLQGEVALRDVDVPILINSVSQAKGYKFDKAHQQPGAKGKIIRLDRISGEGDNDFRIQIRPDEPKLIDESAYQNEITQTTQEEGELEFYCDNKTGYTLDVFIYSWHPSEPVRRGWIGPKVCPKHEKTLITKTLGPSHQRYFFIYGSRYGTEGVELARGNLYRSLKPVLNIWTAEDALGQEKIEGELMY